MDIEYRVAPAWKSEDKVEEDPRIVQKSKFQDSLEDWECRIDALKCRVEEERNQPRAKETVGGTAVQPSTQGQVQDKAPPPIPSCGTRCEPDVWDWVPWEEEMVSEVHKPKLEGAINFALSGQTGI